MLYRDTQVSPFEGWLMISVHRDPLSASATSYNDAGCVGVNVTVPSNSNNTVWNNGKQTQRGNLHVNVGDVIDCTLDLDNSTFTVALPTKWSETIPLDQPDATWFPHFNPHGASFSLV